jgi:enoyl-[acyl-carrier protein] reductase I
MSQLKGLIVGVANENSIAWGCAKALSSAGADIALTYLNEKAKPHVQPLAESINSSLLLPLDVMHQDQFDAVFEEIGKKWGKLDFLIHSIAFAPKDDLFGRVTDCTREGFLMAMDISCHSLARMTKAAEPLMKDGGSILTMTYYGSEKVIPNYNMMGPVKAALESTMRYLAMELGPKGIRVNALSPGPVRTRAASGLPGFDDLLQRSAAESATHENISIDQIGQYAAFLSSPNAKHVTGQVLYVDGGFSIKG